MYSTHTICTMYVHYMYRLQHDYRIHCNFDCHSHCQDSYYLNARAVSLNENRELSNSPFCTLSVTATRGLFTSPMIFWELLTFAQSGDCCEALSFVQYVWAPKASGRVACVYVLVHCTVLFAFAALALLLPPSRIVLIWKQKTSTPRLSFVHSSRRNLLRALSARRPKVINAIHSIQFHSIPIPSVPFSVYS